MWLALVTTFVDDSRGEKFNSIPVWGKIKQCAVLFLEIVHRKVIISRDHSWARSSVIDALKSDFDR